MRGAGLACAVVLIAAAPPPAVPEAPAAAPLGLLLHPVPRCTRAADRETIIVCGRNREAERQTLPFPPPPDPGDPKQFSVSRERNALAERQSGDGMLSCASAVGPSGEFGCLARSMNRAHEQNPGNFVPRLNPDRYVDETPP